MPSVPYGYPWPFFLGYSNHPNLLHQATGKSQNRNSPNLYHVRASFAVWPYSLRHFACLCSLSVKRRLDGVA